MKDPFFITGPATVGVSGGRTSGYMLWRILQAHGGRLPDDVIPCFSNTGKEREETLDFVREIGERWTPITWLEWRDGGFEVVGHNSASRKGEPFEALIKKRRYLPNSVTRFCTIELKIRTTERFARSLGWENWISVVGFRKDEMRRVENMCGRNGLGKDRFTSIAPLERAGIVKADVADFWRRQDFDLKLGQHEGNCDLCFLKNRTKLREIMWDRPDLAAWWIEMERRAREEFKPQSSGVEWTGGGFRPPGRPDYGHLFATRAKQESFDLEEPDALELCYCGDAA